MPLGPDTSTNTVLRKVVAFLERRSAQNGGLSISFHFIPNPPTWERLLWRGQTRPHMPDLEAVVRTTSR